MSALRRWQADDIPAELPELSRREVGVVALLCLYSGLLMAALGLLGYA